MTQQRKLLVDQINEILYNSETKKYRFIRTLETHPDVCKDIIDETAFLNVIPNCLLITRVWYILNDLYEIRRCPGCGKELLTNCNSLNYPVPPLCGSRECAKIMRNIVMTQRYGNDWKQQWASKVKNTISNQYGVDNVMYVPEIRQRQQQNAKSKVDRDGIQILAKREDTVLRRYGVKNVGMCEDHTKKMQDTSLRVYGAVSYSSTAECKAKVSAAWENKTEEERAEITSKHRATFLLHYPSGVSPKQLSARRVLYNYKDIMFDSSYELMYYIYCLDHGIQIMRNTKAIPFVVDDIQHMYIPDFVINSNELVELKGLHFYNAQGDLINPFTDDELIQRIFNAKGKLMKELNVTVITDIHPYKQYVEETYGKDYVQQFKIKSWTHKPRG